QSARALNERAQEHHSGRSVVTARDRWLAVFHRLPANGAATARNATTGAAQATATASARIHAIGHAAAERCPAGNAGSTGNAKNRRTNGSSASGFARSGNRFLAADRDRDAAA